MLEDISGGTNWMVAKLEDAIRNFLFFILCVGPIPNHIAFIMDGNRRYAKKHKIKEEMGYKLGLKSLAVMLKYCYELGVKYITIYAFSIDNFKRSPEEVETIMQLLQETMEGWLERDSMVNKYGIRVHIAGDLTLLKKSVRMSAQKVMESTSKNTKAILSVCIAYTSTNEIVRAVEIASQEKKCVSLVDIERSLDISVATDPDIVIRTSGEKRLSNFLLWQSAYSLLCSPSALWPEIGLWQLVWTVLSFQRTKFYLEKKMKQL